MSTRRGRIAALAVAYFAASTVMLVAPVYTTIGNRVHPRLWGLPWSLVYVLLVVLANFIVLVLLYRGRLIDDHEDTDPDDRPGDRPGAP